MRVPPNKVFLNEEQREYLRSFYANTINHQLCLTLGISERTLARLAREMGLKKDLQAIECQRREKISKAVRATFLRRGHKGNHGNGESTRFKKGYNAIEFFGKEKFDEMHKKGVETRKKIFAEEKARVSFGLPQKTNMRVIHQPRKKILDRSYLKKCGYILDEANNIAYYTDTTRRAVKLESIPKRFYSFKPYEQQ